MESAPTWSEIPQDILRIIGGLIEGMEDYFRFGAVCKSWQLATFSSYDDCPKYSKRRLECPWLMLAENKSEVEAESNGTRGFYSLYNGKEYHLDLPETYGRACFGSSGWLVTLGIDQKMHLLNPVTRKQLPLPSQTTFTDQYPPDFDYTMCNSLSEFIRQFFLHKALVYWAGGSLVVFVIYSRHKKLAMARPGDEAWTPVENSPWGFGCINLFRQQVLAVTWRQIFVCDMSLSPPRLEEFAPVPVGDYSHLYVVNIGGDLYALIGLTYKSPCTKSYCEIMYCFDAFKLDEVRRTWEEVDNLGGWTAFVGRSSTFVLRSSDYPCRPDCVYFTDDIEVYCEVCGGSDYGIYSIKPNSYEGSDSEGDCCGVDDDLVETNGNAVETLIDLDEMSRRPFPISNQFAPPYAPPLWLAPSMW